MEISSTDVFGKEKIFMVFETSGVIGIFVFRLSKADPGLMEMRQP